jgi:alkylhydroperoxidase family enzyme
VIAAPASVITGAPRTQMIVELATRVTRAPWSLSRAHLVRARSAGLGDADVLHVIALAAYFGHLNRIADAVGVPLDYKVSLDVPATDASAPALDPAPHELAGRPALDLGTRTDTAHALAEWRTYIFQRDAPLTRRQRTVITRHVAAWLGDGGISTPDDLTANPLDDALRALAAVVTLAPWQLGDTAFAPLRACGFDDAALFDVCATASSAGVFSRIVVALVALGT